MKDWKTRELGGDAAWSLDPVHWIVHRIHRLVLVLDVHQGLEQRVVIERLVPGRAFATTHEGVELCGLEDEVEALQLPEVDHHVTAAAPVLRTITVLAGVSIRDDVILELEQAHGAPMSDETEGAVHADHGRLLFVNDDFEAIRFKF